jgi:hypothetical protein
MVEETRKMPLAQATPLSPEYEAVEGGDQLWVIGDRYYQITYDDDAAENKYYYWIHRIDTKTGARDEIYAGDDLWGGASVRDGRLFIATRELATIDEDGRWVYAGNPRPYIHDGTRFVPVGMAGDEPKFYISFETEDYFFGYIPAPDDPYGAMGYIPKADYYAGNWDSIVGFDWSNGV